MAVLGFDILSKKIDTFVVKIKQSQVKYYYGNDNNNNNNSKKK